MPASFATTLCAVLSGVPPVVDEADMSVPFDEARDYFQPPSNHRLLYTINATNTTGLDTGAIVGISIGGVLLVVLLLAGIWWWCSRSRQASLQAGAYSQTFNEPPELMPMPYAEGGSSSIFANLAGADELVSTMQTRNASQPSPYGDLSGMPLLTLGQKKGHRQ